jgi:hypothetical protein
MCWQLNINTEVESTTSINLLTSQPLNNLIDLYFCVMFVLKNALYLVWVSVTKSNSVLIILNSLTCTQFFLCCKITAYNKLYCSSLQRIPYMMWSWYGENCKYIKLNLLSTMYSTNSLSSHHSPRKAQIPTSFTLTVHILTNIYLHSLQFWTQEEKVCFCS